MQVISRILGAAVVLAAGSLFLLTPPSQAQDGTQYCVATDGGKTVCGKLKKVERMCVTTNGSNSICGKFKGTEEEREASKPPQRSAYRKEIDGFVYTRFFAQADFHAWPVSVGSALCRSNVAIQLVMQHFRRRFQNRDALQARPHLRG